MNRRRMYGKIDSWYDIIYNFIITIYRQSKSEHYMDQEIREFA